MLQSYDIPKAECIKISVFKNKKDTEPHPYTLGQFFNLVTGATFNRYRAAILELRQVDKDTDRSRYDAIKNPFPGFTISCECCTSRTDHPDRNNGVMCIDIDKGDNDELQDHEWPQLRTILGTLPYVYFSALSAGGKGVFLVIAVDPRQPHKDVFNAFAAMFKKEYRINVDMSCSDVGRLRFISYDPGATQKHPTILFKPIFTPAPIFAPRHTTPHSTGNDDYDRVRAAANVWTSKGIQLCNYDEWYKVAAALKALPDGAQIFDSVSRSSANYKNSADTQKKYAQTKTLTRINPGTFIEICRQHGVTDDEINAEWRRLKGQTAAITMRPSAPPTPPTPEATPHRQRIAFELDRFGVPLWDGRTPTDNALPFPMPNPLEVCPF